MNEGSVEYLWNYTEGEHKITRRKNRATATWSTTSATLTGLGSNPGLRFERPVTNRLSHIGRFPVEVRHFSCLQVVQIGPGVCPDSHSNGAVLGAAFPRIKRPETTYFHLVLRLRMNGAVPPLSLCLTTAQELLYLYLNCSLPCVHLHY